MNIIVYAILATLVFAHTFVATTATVVVLRDKSLKQFQVISKIVISWIALYIGPLFILYVMNEHSPKLVPRFAQNGLLHYMFFAPIRPPAHEDNSLGNDGGYYQNSDASDLGFGSEGSCGAGGD